MLVCTAESAHHVTHNIDPTNHRSHVSYAGYFADEHFGGLYGRISDHS
jgi:hypothetical protein